MIDDRRYLGTFAVLTLVLLRLVIGWHFLGEGLNKIEYDPHDRDLRLDFSAEPFLKQAKGPLAGWYHHQLPGSHGWEQTLASPRQNKILTADVRAEQFKWVSEYNKRREEAIKKGEQAPFEFAPSTPYHAWATQIADDWRATADQFKYHANLTDEQKKQVDAALESRLTQLSEYLAGESEAIAEYRHELWRLQNWRDSAEARGVPFVGERIDTKSAELASKPLAWVQEVRLMETQFHQDLRDTLSDAQRDQKSTVAAVDDALTEPGRKRLGTINLVVTILTLSVGACLLLGLFTRLAAALGALFLAGVIASQPPWIYDAVPTMNQVIEFSGLLVLAATGAGRWLGLDFFLYALFHRHRHDGT